MGSDRSVTRATAHIHHPITMKTVGLLLALACMAAFTSAEPRFQKLEDGRSKLKEMDLGCTTDQLVECEKEIIKALNDCIHSTSIDDIKKCIDELLSMTYCKVCICDVLPFLC